MCGNRDIAQVLDGAYAVYAHMFEKVRELQKQNARLTSAIDDNLDKIKRLSASCQELQKLVNDDLNKHKDDLPPINEDGIKVEPKTKVITKVEPSKAMLSIHPDGTMTIYKEGMEYSSLVNHLITSVAEEQAIIHLEKKYNEMEEKFEAGVIFLRDKKNIDLDKIMAMYNDSKLSFRTDIEKWLQDAEVIWKMISIADTEEDTPTDEDASSIEVMKRVPKQMSLREKADKLLEEGGLLRLLNYCQEKGFTEPERNKVLRESYNSKKYDLWTLCKPRGDESDVTYRIIGGYNSELLLKATNLSANEIIANEGDVIPVTAKVISQ